MTFACDLHFDFIVVGAGIIGLTVANELLQQYPGTKILILEKEHQIGLHASGRNSGVLHSGIYYKEDSLKAKLCLDGSRMMAAYCEQHNLPIRRIGKIIVTQQKGDAPVLDTLYQRALNNGAKVSLMQADDLARVEPLVRTADGRAIFSPETAVVDPLAILLKLHADLQNGGVKFKFKSPCLHIDTTKKEVSIGNETIGYGHLFNTAGLYADKVAKACGLEDRYTMLPFKGLYYELSSASSVKLNHLIYPVPDLNVPFLGVHFTQSVSGKTYLGPTAIPAFGREHYHGFRGIKITEAFGTLTELAHQYLLDIQGFRSYVHSEAPRLFKSHFLNSAKLMVPCLKKHDLIKSLKVGIRAQLFDRETRSLVSDFIVKKTDHETHVLNAVSPAFTSAFSFAKLIVNDDFP